MATAFVAIGLASNAKTETVESDDYGTANAAYVNFLNGSNSDPPAPTDWPFPFVAVMYAWNGERYIISQYAINQA